MSIGSLSPQRLDSTAPRLESTPRRAAAAGGRPAYDLRTTIATVCDAHKKRRAVSARGVSSSRQSSVEAGDSCTCAVCARGPKLAQCGVSVCLGTDWGGLGKPMTTTTSQRLGATRAPPDSTQDELLSAPWAALVVRHGDATKDHGNVELVRIRCGSASINQNGSTPSPTTP